MVDSFVALDFETADYAADSACALGLVRVEQGHITEEWTRLICPPRPRMLFTHIHGLSWKDVCEAPRFGDLWPEVLDFIRGVDLLVAHNASFDRKVLLACCETYGLAAPPQPFECTVQVARKVFGIYPTKLSNVCQVLGIGLNHHEALSDARACAQIMIRALQKESDSQKDLGI